MKPDMPSANASDFRIATCLGTSSPSTRVTYERIMVITITAMESRVFTGILTPISTSQFTITSEKFSAANAEPKKPERVIATCMVDRNFAGWLVSLAKRTARLSP